MSSGLQLASDIVGWMYTIIWSTGYYGQIYENYTLKKVEGFSLDYEVLNLQGFIFYGIYLSIGFFEESNNWGIGQVDIQDLAFVYHALTMVIVLGIQCLIYPRGKNKVSRFAIIVIILLWSLLMIVYCITELFGWVQSTEKFNIFLCFGWAKIVITLIKYTPPAFWNYRRKSTKGWNICNILTDFAGGVLSCSQVFIDCTIKGWQIFNPAKFALGLVGLFFDIIFMFQHYVLYRKNRYDSFVEENSSCHNQIDPQTKDSKEKLKEDAQGRMLTTHLLDSMSSTEHLN